MVFFQIGREKTLDLASLMVCPDWLQKSSNTFLIVTQFSGFAFANKTRSSARTHHNRYIWVAIYEWGFILSEHITIAFYEGSRTLTTHKSRTHHHSLFVQNVNFWFSVSLISCTCGHAMGLSRVFNVNFFFFFSFSLLWCIWN